MTNMRFSFTKTQLGSVGKLPFIRRDEEFAFAEKAAADLAVLDGCETVAELQGIKSVLCGNSQLDWQFYCGKCLGVEGKRVHTALVAYALRAGLGHVYCVKIQGLLDFMRIVHCWRYHGVTMDGLDSDMALSRYGLNDEVPFSVFKEAVGTMWTTKPNGERAVFVNDDGFPTSIYATPVAECVGTAESVQASIRLSAYEAMCCYITSAKMTLPKSIQLLGVGEDSCFILDTSARNGADITEAFSKMVFPKWFFLRLLRFDGAVTQVIDTIE